MVLVAGVDSSTQSCKVVIRDAETGELMRSGRASHPVGTEVSPELWLEALELALQNAGGLADVSAISIGGQQHGMVLLDADGRVIRDALLWNDTRSDTQATQLVEHFGAEWLAEKTGSLPVASFTSTKVLWVAQNEPQNAARIAAICLPHDYLSWRLAGYGPVDQSKLGPRLEMLATDASDASGTGYFCAKTGEYETVILEWILGRVPTLPRIVGPGETAFTVDESNLRIACGAGDNAASALGVGAIAGDVVVSLGTSGTVFAVTNTATADASGTIAGFASASASFLPLVCTLNAARVLDSFAALLEVDLTQLGELALAAPAGAKGIVLLPYFEGERTPNLPTAKASLHGLTLANNTRENLARAAIEGMLCALADGLDAILKAGVECNRVILVGGAAANIAVQKIAAQIFGVPVCIAEPGEYVADGAARQAAWVMLGNCPKWSAKIVNELNVHAEPQVLVNYHEAFSTLYGL